VTGSVRRGPEGVRTGGPPRVGPGTVVGLLGANSPQWVQAYEAAWRQGATALLLNTRLADSELREQLGRARACLVLADADHVGRDLGPVPVRDLAREFPGGSGMRWPVLAPVLAAAPPGRSRRARVVMFTSGSSGSPRGVILTAAQLAASARAAAAHFALGPDDVWLAALPFFHVGGLAILHRMARCDGRVFIVPRFAPEAVREAVAAHRVTRLSLTPTMLERLLAGGWRPPAFLRTLLLGGEPIPADLLARCPRAVAGYGMTETASLVAAGAPGEAALRPLPGFEMRIVGDGGQPCEPGEAGRIAVRGGALMRGYLGGPALEGGWFETGDLGVADATGRFFVLGRADDLILSGGENVSPTEIETALRRHPAVAAAAVAALPDARWGQVPGALVVLRPGCPEPADLAAFLRAGLGGFKVPRYVSYVAELPVLASGKIDRNAVAAALAAGDVKKG